MKYSELDHVWKKIFEDEWESLCRGSKAIAAVIVYPHHQPVNDGKRIGVGFGPIELDDRIRPNGEQENEKR